MGGKPLDVARRTWAVCCRDCASISNSYRKGRIDGAEVILDDGPRRRPSGVFDRNRTHLFRVWPTTDDLSGAPRLCR